ncbi:3-carboxyethylcatechol 2,3-dioxygenase [Nocardia sp. NPDC057668]|uniref:3-carboxyethylcatechol 2,3-dioxygenase n=1 Tax=Nocardia sp. NPDC057668 TaxID=3346202 RepID=UPI0036712F6A
MPLALCCVSHSPLLELPGPDRELLDDVSAAVGAAAHFVREFDPELVVTFSPDHYNGFFYRTMPQFCVGTAAHAVGDYGTYAGALNVDGDLALELAEAALHAGIDVAVSVAMDVDHGTVQPLGQLFPDVGAVPIVPIFLNSVAAPLAPIHRARALGTAVGEFLGTLGKRVLVLGSGGLSHDPPVPTLAGATGAVRERLVHGGPVTAERRAARERQVIAAAQEFDSGVSTLRPLNPSWDREFLTLLDDNRLEQVDTWTNPWITGEAGNSAHEIRTWVAAFAALATQGRYDVRDRYYRPAPALIAGFALRTALPAAGGAPNDRRAA